MGESKFMSSWKWRVVLVVATDWVIGNIGSCYCRIWFLVIVEVRIPFPCSCQLMIMANNGGFAGGNSGKEPACQCRRRKRHGINPFPRSGRPLEEGIAIHSSILHWRIPWTEGPGDLQSMGLYNHTKSDMTKELSTAWLIVEGDEWRD